MPSRPRTPSTRVKLRLDPAAPAEQSLRAISLSLLDTITANIDGARDNLDPEYLHDLRVATRRTRVVLGVARDLLPADARADFKQRFAWLQQVSGPVRDLDVWLLGFAGLTGRVPQALRADLTPLREALAADYDGAQRQLAAALGGAQMQALLTDWRALLTSPSTDHAGPPATTRAFADARIRRMLRRLRRGGRAIDDASPDEALHEVRKDAKRLRYLLEFFQSLYPPDDVRGLIEATKVLLDNLGAIQDLAVQGGHLRAYAARLHAAGAPVGTLLAMGALISAMLTEQATARAGFYRLFAAFDDRPTRRRFRVLIKPATPEPPPVY